MYKIVPYAYGHSKCFEKKALCLTHNNKIISKMLDGTYDSRVTISSFWIEATISKRRLALFWNLKVSWLGSVSHPTPFESHMLCDILLNIWDAYVVHKAPSWVLKSISALFEIHTKFMSDA